MKGSESLRGWSLPSLLSGVCPRDNEVAPPGMPDIVRSRLIQVTSGVFAVVCCLVLTLMTDTFPRSALGADLDSSWLAVLDYAQQRGLQFGSDIVFTYGPLGFLTIPGYSSLPVFSRLAANFLFCFLVSAGVCLLAWRLTLLWRAMFLGIFAVVAANVGWGTADVLMAVGLFSWGFVSILEDRRRVVIFCLALSFLAAFVALVKFTCLLTAGLTIGVVAIDFILRKKPLNAALLVLAFAGFALGAWVGLGQSMKNLGVFIRNGWAISSGYDQAMALEPAAMYLFGSILTLLLAFFVISVRASTAHLAAAHNQMLRRALLWTWACALLFVSWKHGLVRADRNHAAIFFFFVPVLVLGLEASCPTRGGAREWARLMTLFCCVIAGLTLQSIFFPGYLRFLITQPTRVFGKHLAVLTQPHRHWADLQGRQQTVKQSVDLARLSKLAGNSTIDVFGHQQAYALLNDLNYRPRPVFQSYSAYSLRLMQLNEDFYLSSRAPDHVLFRLESQHPRLPALDDARTLRHLLINYEPVEAERQFLLLKKTSLQPTPAKLTLLREGTVHPGDPITTSGFGGANCWLEIEVKPTLLGRLRQVLYQPPGLHLKVWNGEPSNQLGIFRTPAPMLAAGFMANPFLRGNSDVVDLLTGQSVSRSTTYSVELGAENQCFWQPKIRYRLYKIDNELARFGSGKLARLKYPGFQIEPTEVVSPGMSSLSANGTRCPVIPGTDGKPLDVVSGTNTLIEVKNRAVLLVLPGGYMQLSLPSSATKLHGTYGILHCPPGVSGAGFAVEEETPDGSVHRLHTRFLNPTTTKSDIGLHAFSVALSGEQVRAVVLRTISTSPATNAQPVTGWAEIHYE